MPFTTDRAQPALTFIPPSYSPLLRRSLQPIMPLWTALQTNITTIESHHVETLAKAYSEFKAGKARVLLAFRHPSAADPYVLSHLLWRDLPQAARQVGLKNLGTTHSHFLYDRGIPLWAGGYLSWVFSRLGGIPIQRGKLDLLALRTARDLFLNGQFPLAAAPEGGNNGHSEIVSPLEPGIAQLAFWCVEDLCAAERNESVMILPVGIQYCYLEEPWAPLESLISELEADSGIEQPSQQELTGIRERFSISGEDCVGQTSPELCRHADLYGRLYRLAEHLLSLMEDYYQEFYGINFENAASKQKQTIAASVQSLSAEDSTNTALGDRLRTLMDKALQVTEQYFSVRSKGNVIDRCRKLEQAGWDRIFREDASALSPVELGLANRIAEEASIRLWHMRLVESFVAVTGCYVKENPSIDRFAETTLLLSDMVHKITGKSVAQPRFGTQKAVVTVGEPIEVRDRFSTYKRQRRQAIAQLTQDLQHQMESLIIKT